MNLLYDGCNLSLFVNSVGYRDAGGSDNRFPISEQFGRGKEAVIVLVGRRTGNAVDHRRDRDVDGPAGP